MRYPQNYPQYTQNRPRVDKPTHLFYTQTVDKMGGLGIIYAQEDPFILTALVKKGLDKKLRKAEPTLEKSFKMRETVEALCDQGGRHCYASCPFVAHRVLFAVG